MPTRLVFSTLLALVLAAKPGWGDKLPPSNSCTAHVSLGRVDLSWIAVPGAESYAISRDGVFLGTAPPTYPTVWVDYPPRALIPTASWPRPRVMSPRIRAA